MLMNLKLLSFITILLTGCVNDNETVYLQPMVEQPYNSELIFIRSDGVKKIKIDNECYWFQSNSTVNRGFSAIKKTSC